MALELTLQAPAHSFNSIELECLIKQTAACVLEALKTAPQSFDADPTKEGVTGYLRDHLQAGSAEIIGLLHSQARLLYETARVVARNDRLEKLGEHDVSESIPLDHRGRLLLVTALQKYQTYRVDTLKMKDDEKWDSFNDTILARYLATA